MKTLKRIISILVIFALFASLTAVNVGAVSTPASLMGKYINFGTFDADGDGTAEPMVYYVAARDDVNADGIGDYYLLSADSLMSAGISKVSNYKDSNNKNPYRINGAWPKTFLRAYLNSSAEAGQVEYETVLDEDGSALYADDNYKDRAGFMKNFNSYETSLILPVTHKSISTQWHRDYHGMTLDGGTANWSWAGDVHKGTGNGTWYGKHTTYADNTTLSNKWRYLDYYTNVEATSLAGSDGELGTEDDVAYGEAYYMNTTDYVFVPSIVDAYKYKLPLHELVATNNEKMWLRDATNGANINSYYQKNSTFERQNVSRITAMTVETQYQIRPCMFIDGSVKYNVTGDGTKDNPYTLVESKACEDLTGKYIYFGEYGPSAEEKYPIKWYIAGAKDVDGDGEDEYYLSASEIISLKSMSLWNTSTDAYEHVHQRRNSSQWVASPLRAWLNSDEETVSAYGKYVTYDSTNEETVYSATTSASNIATTAKVATPAYSAEAGFLTNFTAEEKAMIKPVKHKSLMAIGGYKDSNIKGLGFTVNADDPTAASPVQGGYFNMLEYAGNASSGTYNTVSNVIVPGTAANDIWQGIHTGRGADFEDSDYFWIDALTNINGVRGNNFGDVTFDSKAAYIESTDTVFVPSLFDVAEFGGKMLRMTKQNNNINFGYQCGSGVPSDVNNGGFMWLRDIGVSADNDTAKFVLGYSPVVGPKSLDIAATGVGVQPAMYVSLDTADTFGVGTYDEPLVLKTNVSGADGSVDIAYNGANVTATGYVYNTTADENKFTLIIAKYAVEGEEGEEELVLKEAVPASKTLGAAAGTDTITESVTYEEGYVYKAFLWNSDSFAPYTAAKTLN